MIVSLAGGSDKAAIVSSASLSLSHRLLRSTEQRLHFLLKGTGRKQASPRRSQRRVNKRLAKSDVCVCGLNWLMAQPPHYVMILVFFFFFLWGSWGRTDTTERRKGEIVVMRGQRIVGLGRRMDVENRGRLHIVFFFFLLTSLRRGPFFFCFLFTGPDITFPRSRGTESVCYSKVAKEERKGERRAALAAAAGGIVRTCGLRSARLCPPRTTAVAPRERVGKRSAGRAR
ncbi:hypothetical protein B0J12DRAFT_230356 [Macrophomina phaseolina]|uniref:Transmembrane protein n=1 Tax=Macrophomina phaseolina TaxID=35725 RepID=A0ABQ8GPY7_9PEZI|nr:hypothetical protein B0J12DRAFT_230356 [Macrophomina phaseolina]